MYKAKRIFIIADIKCKPVKVFVDQIPKIAKGFIRLGHDVRFFSYCDVLAQFSPLKSRTLSKLLFKPKVDEFLADQLKSYKPDIVYINFPRVFDADTIRHMRQAAPNAVFIGEDGDPWPKLQKNRIDTAKELDILIATNNGQFLQDYRDAGVPLCVFMPNMCDPDNDHRYEVGSEWQTDILWTGNVTHHADTSDTLRKKLVTELAKQNNCTLYGCFGRPKIGGFDYLYAISGARIGVNANAVNSIRMYHSDRLTHYLACGTFVLAKRVPDTDLLFKDCEHLRYFDDVNEFFELTDWYLKHEDERKKIADAGMRRVHEQFNCVKIIGYILELAEKGSYSAPWTIGS
ncbi:MAG: glycosyltransferase family 1 protein [Planctomycetes bacterium]|nr:glycosyltransferase family 1 protein [Planctomycetota bacterium]